MTAKPAAAKPRPARVKRDTAPAAIVGTAPIAAEAERRTSPFGQIIPSSPQPVPLYQLRRATENVRHTRVDEDVLPLAEDIAAHGLLQSLIGYRDADGCVHVVGGGRRFQALRHLENEGVIDGDWPVPVLIRDVDDAIELSLAENLQQRTMSPVDEFLAFRALMNRGDTSPAGLAKRFGFSERVVKQRLRLAELAEPILDALAGKEITVDAAMAYAATQDQKLQAEVFKAEAKKSYEPHKPRDIRWAIQSKGESTTSALFRFVGEESYERRGGGYEDDLFSEEKKDGRALANPGVLHSAARDMITFQMEALLPRLRERKDLAPTITGFLIASDLLVKHYGNAAPKPPSGYVQVERHDKDAMWKVIRANKIDVIVFVGIDENGELTVFPRIVFVPKGMKNTVSPPQPSYGYQPETPLERAVRERKQGVERISRQLAVGPFAGSPFEGRAYWPKWDRAEPTTLGGKRGWFVAVNVFVTDEQVAAQQAAAEARYDQERAEKEAAEQARTTRLDELSSLSPPAVVVVDGEAWARGEDGTYAAIDEEGDGGYAGSWTALLSNYRDVLDQIGATFATREEFDAAMSAPAPDDEPDPGVNDATRELAEVDA
jgi:ParB family chromosome partitioning protein